MAYSDIRNGLAKILRQQISGLRVYTEDPDSDLEYPCVVIGQFLDYDYLPILEAGGFHAELSIMLFVASHNTSQGMDDIEDYRWPNGNKSIFNAINQDNTLDGNVNHAWVRRTGAVERNREGNSRIWEFSTEFIIQVTHTVGI